MCRMLTFICDIWYMLAAMSSVVVLKGCSKQMVDPVVNFTLKAKVISHFLQYP